MEHEIPLTVVEHEISSSGMEHEILLIGMEHEILSIGVEHKILSIGMEHEILLIGVAGHVHDQSAGGAVGRMRKLSRDATGPTVRLKPFSMRYSTSYR